MLNRLTIKNFRCFRSVDVPLRPLTILIGPNDSGKSAFLTAVAYLTANHGWSDGDHWRFDPTRNVLILSETDSGTVKHGQPSDNTAWPAADLQPIGLYPLACP